jgi:hypothetical protein
MSRLAPTGFSSQMFSRAKENFPNPDRAYTRFRGRRRACRRFRKTANHFHLDTLPEGGYLRLVCLLKSNKNASNYCREPWTC